MLIGMWRAAFLCAMVALPISAAPTQFVFKQLVVGGSSDVQVAAINNKIQYVGSYLDNNGSHGFMFSGGVPTLLAPGPGCSGVMPAAVNVRTTILGFVACGNPPEPGLFDWWRGVYNPNCCFALGQPNPDYHVGINATGVVFFNTASLGSGNNGWLLGTPLNFASIYPPGSNAEICSINSGGIVAGVATGSDVPPIFFQGPGATFTTFAPPAVASISGCAFINDAGGIAGGYVDKTGTPHGFVYDGSGFVLFGMPVTATSVTVDAYNNKGRAVGSYFDPAKQMWYLFWYNGASVTVFGHFMARSQLSLALNDSGILMLAVRNLDGGQSRSYRVLCVGVGC